ncbi:synaptonemal complex protein 3-like isoform X2 [Syngnathoides biaculeatus]|uniref:synaptonemal complex protein 3-like isoform X2 n=1 Tax=Syngnathoides biaculeatus TaxID=300417 RepID=UPI002ADD547E|nr:synaptonemal complex protein 3-like isoform X2 [Syngnathoides biaculeatus]
MSAGKRMKKKRLTKEDVGKVFNFSPNPKNKALHCGLDDYLGQDKTSNEDKAPLRKRAAHEFNDEETAVDVGYSANCLQFFTIKSEIDNMLECFEVDINNVMLAKRKRLESLTKNYMKAGQQKMEQLWNKSHKQRQKMMQPFSQQLSSVLLEWKLESQKLEEEEKKLNDLIRQKQKLMLQINVIQKQQLKDIGEIFKNFFKNMEEMDKSQEGALHQAQEDLRKEMATLQEKMLRETQQQRLASFRKSLETMLF